MPRPRSIIPRRQYNLQLPDDIYARVLAHIWSPAENCAPYGAFSGFIEQCVREHFRRLDEEKANVSNS
jgi:hypothetical protein